MINDETKKYREIMAFGLLGAAVLAVIGALSLLFKSGDDLGGGDIGFAEKSAAFGALFESSLVVLTLVGAVFLVTRFGEPSPNARIVVLAAMGIGAIDLLFAVITFFAQFGADSGFDGIMAGVFGAGKVVGGFLGLAQLIFLVVGLAFVVTTYLSLPAPVAAPAPQWGAGQYAGYVGQNPQAAPGQQPWRQGPDVGPGGQPGQPGQQGFTQQGWAQPAASGGWATPGEGQQPAWGQPPPAPAWPPQPDPSGWGQPQGYPPAAPVAPVAPVAPTAPAFWESHDQPAVEPDVFPEPAPEPPSVETSAAAPVDSPESEPVTDTTSDSDSGSDSDNAPPGQGWWQHPGQ